MKFLALNSFIVVNGKYMANFNGLCTLLCVRIFYNLNVNLIPSVIIPVPIMARISPINLPITEGDVGNMNG